MPRRLVLCVALAVVLVLGAVACAAARRLPIQNEPPDPPVVDGSWIEQPGPCDDVNPDSGVLCVRPRIIR